MKERILIVEDDTALARVIETTLDVEGFEVKWVADGGVALEAAREFSPHVVLLDLSLPTCDGFELCSHWCRGQRIPVVILSARVQKGDKLRGLALGADDYITKPFDLEELLARIAAQDRDRSPRAQVHPYGARGRIPPHAAARQRDIGRAQRHALTRPELTGVECGRRL